MRHITRLAIHQITVEYALYVLAISSFNQITRKVGTAYHIGVSGKVICAFQRSTDAGLRQLISHFSGTVATPATHTLQSFRQWRVSRIDAQANNVQGMATPRHGNLHTLNEGHTVLSGS